MANDIDLTSTDSDERSEPAPDPIHATDLCLSEATVGEMVEMKREIRDDLEGDDDDQPGAFKIRDQTITGSITFEGPVENHDEWVEFLRGPEGEVEVTGEVEMIGTVEEFSVTLDVGEADDE